MDDSLLRPSQEMSCQCHCKHTGGAAHSRPLPSGKQHYHRGTSRALVQMSHATYKCNVTCYLQVQCHMLLTSPMSHATYKSNVTCYLRTSITSLLSAQEFPTANFGVLCTRMHFCNYSSYIRPHQTHICVRLTLSFWVVLPLTSCMWSDLSVHACGLFLHSRRTTYESVNSSLAA